MAKDMSNNDIAAYEGGDYEEIMDNYDLHEITAAIANRAGKAADTVRSLEQEVEEIKNNPDVVDIVATYADLQAYDTSILTDKDIIRVLEDSTHNDNSTYYRWNATTNQFDFVGEISGGSSVNVVQTTGTSTTDVMSQNAVTSMVFADPSTKLKVQIGNSAAATGNNSIAIGESTAGQLSIAMGRYANATARESIAIGNNAYAAGQSSINIYGGGKTNGFGEIRIGNGPGDSNHPGAVAIGYGSCASANGEFNIGDKRTTGTAYGYNNSRYRLLTGLYDPQSAHDAATKGYVDSIAVGTDESYTIATSDWTALSASTPYTYQATVTATATIGANSTVELINDNAVLFGTYGFAIGSVDTVNNQITIYSVGQPSASVTLTVNIKG